MKTINSFTTVGGVGGSENYQKCRAHSLTLTTKLYLSIETENLWSHKKIQMETAAIKNCEIAFGGKNVNEPYILRKHFEFLTEDFSKTIRYTQESISRDD